MEYLSPIKWIQEVTQSCLDYITYMEHNEKLLTYVTTLREAFENFPENEKHKIHMLLMEKFEVKDSVLILSYIINVVHIEEFITDVAKQIYIGDYDSLTKIMLEIQLVFHENTDRQLQHDIHHKNIIELKSNLKMKYSYIPISKRDKKKIVIITEQLLPNSYHAPTLMTLESAYVLQKYFDYEVRIITCTSNKRLAPTVWIEVQGFNSSGSGYQQWLYKGMEISVYQYPMDSCTINDYKEMLQKIYQYNPLFVLNMGVNNPISDLPHFFTTVVARDMSTQVPVSEADIVILGGSCIEEDEAIKELDWSQKQIVMEQKFPVIVNKSDHIFTRRELNLPEDKFLVCIVGNRLDKEVDKNFICYMQSILSKSPKIDFVIIGDTERLQSKFSQTIYETRVHFLGFCKDLIGVYHILDLYLNPKRLGGGWSSAIALQAGLPVVTLPNCDVAYNVSENFIVSNERKMVETVLRYASDEQYYKKQADMARICCARESEEQSIAYITELLNKVKEAMFDD